MKKEQTNWETELREKFHNYGRVQRVPGISCMDMANIAIEIFSQEKEKMVEEIKKHAYYEYRPEVKGVWYLQANKKIIGLDTLLDLLQNK